MAFGDLLSQLGLGNSQPQNSFSNYGSVDPGQLAMLAQYVQPQQSIPQQPQQMDPLSQYLMSVQQGQGQGGAPAPTSAPTPSPAAAQPPEGGSLNDPPLVISGQQRRPLSTPAIPGSQTPTGGPNIPTGNPWQSQYAQTGLETPGIPDKASALFGLMHGHLAQTLNNFQDKVYMAQGHAPPNYTRVLQQQEANALQGFTQHPMEAIQRLAQVDPQGAQEMYMKQLEASRVGQAAADTHASAQNNLENSVLGSAGRILNNSTPDNYAAHYDLAQQLAQKNGFSLDPLGVPDPAEVAAGKHVAKDNQGNTIWDDDTQKSLSTARNYGTPSYRVENTAASTQQAQARLMQAQTGRMVAPSTIAFHNSLAGAASRNATTRASMLDLDTQFRQGQLDETDYANALRALIAEANNPQMSGKIPSTPRGRGGPSGGSPAPAPIAPTSGPQSNSSDPVVAVGTSKATNQKFYRHRSGAISSTP